MKVLPESKNIKPFPRTLIPEGHKFTGTRWMRDGGVPCASIWLCRLHHQCNLQPRKEESNILTARSKIGKKSIPGHEVLSANQAAEACKDVIRALKDRPEIQEASPTIIMAGDSICVACLFNPQLQIRNTLLRPAVNNTLQRCR